MVNAKQVNKDTNSIIDDLADWKTRAGELESYNFEGSLDFILEVTSKANRYFRHANTLGVGVKNEEGEPYIPFRNTESIKKSIQKKQEYYPSLRRLTESQIKRYASQLRQLDSFLDLTLDSEPDLQNIVSKFIKEVGAIKGLVDEGVESNWDDYVEIAIKGFSAIINLKSSIYDRFEIGSEGEGDSVDLDEFAREEFQALFKTIYETELEKEMQKHGIVEPGKVPGYRGIFNDIKYKWYSSRLNTKLNLYDYDGSHYHGATSRAIGYVVGAVVSIIGGTSGIDVLLTYLTAVDGAQTSWVHNNPGISATVAAIGILGSYLGIRGFQSYVARRNRGSCDKTQEEQEKSTHSQDEPFLDLAYKDEDKSLESLAMNNLQAAASASPKSQSAALYDAQGLIFAIGQYMQTGNGMAELLGALEHPNLMVDALSYIGSNMEELRNDHRGWARIVTLMETSKNSHSALRSIGVGEMLQQYQASVADLS